RNTTGHTPGFLMATSLVIQRPPTWVSQWPLTRSTDRTEGWKRVSERRTRDAFSTGFAEDQVGVPVGEVLPSQPATGLALLSMAEALPRTVREEVLSLVHLARLPLEGGGCVLVETSPASGGPVKAGRVSEAVQDLPGSLQAALVPISAAAHAAVEQLRKAGPQEIAVEFGVDLAVEAGAVITRAGAQAHLHVTVRWVRDDFASLSGDGKAG
ncbi:CU044_2847 family protein, partial [Streptomyces avermitilis]|uniref:CU044_2847 family protein n=1 Tax=Streptomyces avermitilis TaxID=33903 RepID=UPI00369B333C